MSLTGKCLKQCLIYKSEAHRKSHYKIYDDFNKRNFNFATTTTVCNILSKKIIGEESRAFEMYIVIRKTIYTFYIKMVYHSTYFALSMQNKLLRFFLIEKQIVVRVDKKINV